MAFFPQKLYLWFTNFVVFYYLLFNTEVSGLQFFRTPEPFDKNWCCVFLCLFDNKTGVSSAVHYNSLSIHVALFRKYWVYFFKKRRQLGYSWQKIPVEAITQII